MTHCENETRQWNGVERGRCVGGCHGRGCERLSGWARSSLVGVHGWCCVSCRLDAVYDVVRCFDVGGKHEQ